MGSHIGVSIISTLLVSLAVALFFVPMAAYLILRSKKVKQYFMRKFPVAETDTGIFSLVKDLSAKSG